MEEKRDLLLVDSNDLISLENNLFKKFRGSLLNSGLTEDGSLNDGVYFNFHSNLSRSSVLKINSLNENYGSNQKVRISLYGFSDYCLENKTCMLPQLIGLNATLNQSDSGLVFFSDLKLEQKFPFFNEKIYLSYTDLDINKKDFPIILSKLGYGLENLSFDLERVFSTYFPKDHNLVSSSNNLENFLDLHNKGILKGISSRRKVELECWIRNHIGDIKNSDDDISLLRTILLKQNLYKAK